MEKTLDEHGWSCSKEAYIASCHGFVESILKSVAWRKSNLEIGFEEKNAQHKRGPDIKWSPGFDGR
jgi:hypothetical protein